MDGPTLGWPPFLGVRTGITAMDGATPAQIKYAAVVTGYLSIDIFNRNIPFLHSRAAAHVALVIVNVRLNFSRLQCFLDCIPSFFGRSHQGPTHKTFPTVSKLKLEANFRQLARFSEMKASLHQIESCAADI